MPNISRTSRAEQDLVDIWVEIAEYGERPADKIVDLIEEQCKLLLRHPRGGEACPRFGHDMRWFPAGNYIIFYRPDENGIQVVRVIDGRRDLDAAF